MSGAVWGWTPLARVYDPIAVGSIDGTDTVPHDRAVLRAATGRSHRPNPGVTGDPECSVFVARLNHVTDEPRLNAAFTRFGAIKSLRLMRDLVTGASKGYAFVEYFDTKVAERVYAEMNKEVIDDREILVDYVCARSMEGWVPRRLGGGFGGRKESGQLRFGCRDRPFRKPILVKGVDFVPVGRDWEGAGDGGRYGRRLYGETEEAKNRALPDGRSEAYRAARELSRSRDDRSRLREIRRECPDAEHSRRRNTDRRRAVAGRIFSSENLRVKREPDFEGKVEANSGENDSDIKTESIDSDRNSSVRELNRPSDSKPVSASTNGNARSSQNNASQSERRRHRSRTRSRSKESGESISCRKDNRRLSPDRSASRSRR